MLTKFPVVLQMMEPQALSKETGILGLKSINYYSLNPIFLYWFNPQFANYSMMWQTCQRIWLFYRSPRSPLLGWINPFLTPQYRSFYAKHSGQVGSGITGYLFASQAAEKDQISIQKFFLLLVKFGKSARKLIF